MHRGLGEPCEVCTSRQRPACCRLEAAVGASEDTLPHTEPLTPARPRGARQVCRAQPTSPPVLCTPDRPGSHLGNGALGKMTPSSNVLWPSASTRLAHNCVAHSAVSALTCWPEFLHPSDLWRQALAMCRCGLRIPRGLRAGGRASQQHTGRELSSHTPGTECQPWHFTAGKVQLCERPPR